MTLTPRAIRYGRNELLGTSVPPHPVRATVPHGRRCPKPIQSVAHWEEKARLAQEKAEAMCHPKARTEMLELVELYRQLAEQTRKMIAVTEET
jgi:hypothetical protein